MGNFSQAVSPNICDYGNTELGLFSIRKETFVMELEGRKGQFWDEQKQNHEFK